jgi:hypothetical protein
LDNSTQISLQIIIAIRKSVSIRSILYPIIDVAFSIAYNALLRGSAGIGRQA